MKLSPYNKKRNFRQSPEPTGKSGKLTPKPAFVVQRHKASHLHYDFRLEVNGVLKSWAIPKGPSMNPNDKRLAMLVEDHPYDYKNFEGVIPEGNYGAGTVEIWDEGFYSDSKNSAKKTLEKKILAELKAGSMKFTLYGKKLKGEFALVKMKGRQENAWLLIKHKDEFAVTEKYDSETQVLQKSPFNKHLSEPHSPEPVSSKKANYKTALKKKSKDTSPEKPIK